MRKKISFLIPFMVVIGAALAMPANSAEKRLKVGKKAPAQTAKTFVKPNNLGAVTGVTGGGAVFLSISECTNLGGTVFITSVCNTGHACQRKDEDSNTHMVCISEIN